MSKSILQQALESAGYTIHDYISSEQDSSCLGVNCNNGEFGNVFADVLIHLTEDQLGDLDVVARDFRKMCFDKRGNNIIVYFPGVECGGDEDDW
jgi:hypothetical protein